MMVLSDKRIGSRGADGRCQKQTVKSGMCAIFFADVHKFVITVYWPLGDMSLSVRKSQEGRERAVLGMHHCNT